MAEPEPSTSKCQGCGAETVDLVVLDCEPTERGAVPWRRVRVCDGCIERLDADMWISERCWAGIDAVVPFDELPLMPIEDEYAPDPDRTWTVPATDALLAAIASSNKGLDEALKGCTSVRLVHSPTNNRVAFYFEGVGPSPLFDRQVHDAAPCVVVATYDLPGWVLLEFMRAMPDRTRDVAVNELFGFFYGKSTNRVAALLGENGQTGEYYVVEFAESKGGEVNRLLLSEDQYDRWCQCEPPEGYAKFNLVSKFEIDDVTVECLANLAKLHRTPADEASGGRDAAPR